MKSPHFVKKFPLLELNTGASHEWVTIDQRRKAMMINIIVVVAIMALFPLGISAHYFGKTIVGYMDHVFAGALAILLLYFHKTKNYLRVTHIGVFLAAIMFGYLFISKGVSGTGHLWCYTFPLFAFFVLGHQKGLWASLGLLSTILLYFFFQQHLPFDFENYTSGFAVRFVPSFLVVLAYAYTFEKLRDNSHTQLSLINKELEQVVDQLQEKDEELSSAYDDLEARVQRRTAELNETNMVIEQEMHVRHQVEQRLQQSNQELEKKVAERTHSLKVAKQIAEAANKAKSTFLANMSHELRTPLNHIIGFTELVVDKQLGALNSTQEEYLNDALNGSHHLLSLINDILDLSKVEAGKMELEPSDVDLTNLLENSLVMVKEKAMKHRIQLSTHFDGIPEMITADERKLKQILYNLLSNAAKFSDDNGCITLSAQLCSVNDGFAVATDGRKIIIPKSDSALQSNHHTGVEISVIDTGIGLKKEHLEHIFDPFRQVESSNNRLSQGTGLGLSLTRHLVKMHGGVIWAESEG